MRDVAYVANWLSEVGALGGVARFLDASLPQPPDLTALSGHAFQLVVREGPEGLFPIAAPAGPSYARAVAQYSVLGLRGRIYEVRPEDRASRDEALRAVRRSIDRKRPVIAFGLHIPEFGIIRGYDDDRAQLIVSTLTTEQHGPALPLALWPAPNTKEAIPIVVVDRERRIRTEVAEQEALAFAVREYEAKTGAGELAVGAAGYECWISALGSERAALHGRGHAHAVQKLLAARREAAQFLAGLA
ncbi:MAG TPA: hypothetical protein VNL92_07990, partial [Dehalococcoidia bacterium]|nr:hypothetical protein [Dehalococcoidia bacterium]